MTTYDIDEIIASANSLVSAIRSELENSVLSPIRREISRSPSVSIISPEVQRQLDSIDRQIQSISNVPDEAIVEDEDGVITSETVTPLSRRRNRQQPIVVVENEIVPRPPHRRNPQQPNVVVENETVPQSSRRRNQQQPTVVVESETVPQPSRRRNQQQPIVVVESEIVPQSSRHRNQQQTTVEIIDETILTPRLHRRNQQPITVDIIDLCCDSPENTIRIPEPVNLVSPVDTLAARRIRRRRRTRSPLALDDCNDDGTSPTNKLRSSDETAKKSDARLICAICMENYSSREPTSTKCGHIFCKNCINRSLQNLGPRCPICRGRINSRSLLRLHL